AASKLTRVRSEGFSNTRVMTRCARWRGRSPCRHRFFTSAASRRMSLRSFAVNRLSVSKCFIASFLRTAGNEKPPRVSTRRYECLDTDGDEPVRPARVVQLSSRPRRHSRRRLRQLIPFFSSHFSDGNQVAACGGWAALCVPIALAEGRRELT